MEEVMRNGHDLKCSSNYGPAPCDCQPKPWPPPQYDDPTPAEEMLNMWKVGPLLSWEQDIAQRISCFSPDERRVLTRIVEGIEKGREVYGPMDLANDKRDLVSEAEDEVRDYVIYRAMLRVKAERQ